MRSIFISWLAVISSGFAFAQLDTPSVPNSLGFELPMANSSFTISIGEPAITTLNSSASIITQGYLQPIDRTPCQDVNFVYYPNPAEEYINIELIGCDDTIQSVQIIDIWGRVITTVFNPKDNQIILGELSQGMYVFRVILSGGSIGSFSAIKVPGR